jgi:hypothetical protein
VLFLEGLAESAGIKAMASLGHGNSIVLDRIFVRAFPLGGSKR